MQALHLFDEKLTKKLGTFMLFCFPLFFFFLVENTMSYIFPIIVVNQLHSNTIMGLISAFSSIVGFGCDLIFPQLIGEKTWRFQLVIGMLLSFGLPFFTSLGGLYSLAAFFILASIIWGLYFELLAFAQQSFIVDEENKDKYSADWGVIYMLTALTGTVAPIIGSLLLKEGHINYNIILNFFNFAGLIFAFLVVVRIPPLNTKKIKSQTKTTINLIKELRYWDVIGERIIAVMLIGVIAKLIDGLYWEIGGLFGEQIAKGNGLDWMIVGLYSLASIISPLLLTRLRINKRKKFYSQLALLFGGLVLAGIALFKNNLLIFAAVFISSFVIGFMGPLNEAVYSDLLERIGKSRAHLLAIAKSNSNVGYIFAPLIAGILADLIGYQGAFATFGVLCFIIAIILLITTPRKIKLPQKALESLNENN